MYALRTFAVFYKKAFKAVKGIFLVNGKTDN